MIFFMVLSSVFLTQHINKNVILYYKLINLNKIIYFIVFYIYSRPNKKGLDLFQLVNLNPKPCTLNLEGNFNMFYGPVFFFYLPGKGRSTVYITS